jgi:hypothetical protein
MPNRKPSTAATRRTVASSSVNAVGSSVQWCAFRTAGLPRRPVRRHVPHGDAAGTRGGTLGAVRPAGPAPGGPSLGAASATTASVTPAPRRWCARPGRALRREGGSRYAFRQARPGLAVCPRRPVPGLCGLRPRTVRADAPAAGRHRDRAPGPHVPAGPMFLPGPGLPRNARRPRLRRCGRGGRRLRRPGGRRGHGAPTAKEVAHAGQARTGLGRRPLRPLREHSSASGRRRVRGAGQSAWRRTASTRWSTSCSVVAKEVTKRTTPGSQRSW